MVLLSKIVAIIVAPFLALSAWVSPPKGMLEEPLGLSISKGIVEFQDSLNSPMTASSSSFTLVRGTNNNTGTTLSGQYIFKIDSELIDANCTGTACTINLRGLSDEDVETEVYALKKRHERFAVVKITDAYIIRLSRILNGNETIPNKLTYASVPTLTADADIATKKYADDLAIAGSPDMTATVKGISEKASGAEAAAGTATGDTTAPLSLTTGISTSSPYTTGNYVVVSEADGDISSTFIGQDQDYAWTGTHSFGVTTTLTGNVSGQDADWSIFTAGESLTAGNAVYLKSTDGYVWKTSTEYASTTYSFIGIVKNTVAASGAAYVQRSGLVTGLSGLTSGASVFLSTTGSISTTAPTTRTLTLGFAKGTTALVLAPRPIMVSKAGGIAVADSATLTLPIAPRKVSISITEAASVAGGAGGANITYIPGIGFSGIYWYVLNPTDAESSAGTITGASSATFTFKTDENGSSDKSILVTLRALSTGIEIQNASSGAAADTTAISYSMLSEF